MRVRSNGRQGDGSSAPSAANPLYVSRQSPSAPPASTRSDRPWRIHAAARRMAEAPLEHALHTVRTRRNGPAAALT